MKRPKGDYQDPFAPPIKENPVVECLHCGEQYRSWEMRFDDIWYCKNEECDGAGFGFDILPVKINLHISNKAS